jgi:hypothetical protein
LENFAKMTCSSAASVTPIGWAVGSGCDTNLTEEPDDRRDEKPAGADRESPDADLLREMIGLPPSG